METGDVTVTEWPAGASNQGDEESTETTGANEGPMIEEQPGRKERRRRENSKRRVRLEGQTMSALTKPALDERRKKNRNRNKVAKAARRRNRSK